jgi:hypothetical protein
MSAERPEPIKVYVEHSAWTAGLGPLKRDKRITIMLYPYNEASRRTDERAESSRITWASREIRCSNRHILCSDGQHASDLLENIERIIGRGNETDVLHVDSAYKSGCRCLLTTDKGDILRNREELRRITGMAFFNSNTEFPAFMQWLEQEESRTPRLQEQVHDSP